MKLAIVVIVEIVFIFMVKYGEPMPEPKAPELFNHNMQAHYVMDKRNEERRTGDKEAGKAQTFSAKFLFFLRFNRFMPCDLSSCHNARVI